MIRAGTGTMPSSRAAPCAPSRTSPSPSPHAPRTCGDHAAQASGRLSSAHATEGGAEESADQERMRHVLPAGAVTSPAMADVWQEESAGGARALPARDDAREWLATMMLIRRFEERAGEMYAKAKIGGFLHLASARRRRSSARPRRCARATT